MENMKKSLKQRKLQELQSLISKIEEHITDNSDMIWTSCEDSKQLKKELQLYKNQLVNNDLSSLDNLYILFLPTSDLQEHSMSNGWSDEYLKLSSKFDSLYKSLKRTQQKDKYCLKIKNIYKSILELFFPSLCINCSTRLHQEERFICLDCLSKLPKTNYHLQDDNRLEHFLAGKFPFEKAMAFCYFYKHGSLQKIIHEFKYNNNPQLAFFMGELYGDSLLQADFIKNIDFLIPVPLHPKKEKKRGYNQAEEICKGISQATDIPICNTAIIRTINNPSQTKHSKIERWKNVEGIFNVTNIPSLKDKTILLVDDVITSGSTLEAIIKSFSPDQMPKIYIASLGMAM